MKNLIFVWVLLVPLYSFAKTQQDDGLPIEPDTTLVNLNKIAQGPTINLDLILTLPATQNLNKGAPSFVAVFEKRKNEKKWTQTQRLDLNSVLIFGDQLHFTKNISLQFSDSEVAVFSTIFHCGKDHKTACYIQGFKGTTSRSLASDSTRVPFYIEGKMR
jgi:hypothetical protein